MTREKNFRPYGQYGQVRKKNKPNIIFILHRNKKYVSKKKKLCIARAERVPTSGYNYRVRVMFKHAY